MSLPVAYRIQNTPPYSLPTVSSPMPFPSCDLITPPFFEERSKIFSVELARNTANVLAASPPVSVFPFMSKWMIVFSSVDA